MRKLVVALCACLIPGLALAEISLTWTAPTERIDGSPLPAAEIAGYDFEVTFNGTPQPGFSAPGAATSYAYTDTQRGRYCFRARTVDTDGLVSDWTPEVCRKANPRPASGLRAR